MTRIELLQTARLIDAPGSRGGACPRGKAIRHGEDRIGRCAGFEVRDALQQGEGRFDRSTRNSIH